MLGMSAAEAPRTCMPLARQAALRAVQIDDNLAEAHTSLAAVMANFDWDRSGARREFQRALVLDPSYPTLHQWYGLFLLAPEGLFDNAVDELRRAERLEPISLPINLDHALIDIFAGRTDDAARQCTKVLDLDASYYRAHWFLGLVHDRQGDFQAAIESLERALTHGSSNPAFRLRIQGALGHAFGRGGQRDRAIAILADMERLSETTYVDQVEVAKFTLVWGMSRKP